MSAGLLLAALFLSPFAAPLEEATNNRGGRYEWESFDLYQILGLSAPPSAASGRESSPSNGGTAGVRGTPKFKSRRKREAERSRVMTPDVRRAYMRQALLFHPDKVKSRCSQRDASPAEELGEDGGVPISEEESAARFSRIAEAYEVLSDAERRAEYDEYLLDHEDEASGRKRPPNFLQNFTKDARCVFEEFFAPKDKAGEFSFAGGDSSGSGEDTSGEYVPPIELISFIKDDTTRSTTGQVGGDKQHNRQPHSSHRPKPKKEHARPPPDTVLMDTSETIETFYEPRYRADVTRVLRKEIFAAQTPDGAVGPAVYHRTLGQDFIEVESRCSGRTLGHIAVSRPFLVEGGTLPGLAGAGGGMYGYYREIPGHGDGRQREDASQARPGRRTNGKLQKRRRSNSILLPNEFLAQGDRPLISPDGRYRAGLSRECRIIITEVAAGREGRSRGDGTVVWSSKNSKPSRPDRCYLAMYGPQLILGDVEDESDVLWFTPPLIPDAEGTSMDDGGHYYYYASLDNDGRVGVYKRWRRAMAVGTEDLDDLAAGGPRQFRGGSSASKNATGGASGSDSGYSADKVIHLVCGAIRRLVEDALLWYNPRPPRSGIGGGKVDECIYVTGPGNGCRASGRLPIQVNGDRWARAMLDKTAGMLRPVLSVVTGILRIFL